MLRNQRKTIALLSLFLLGLGSAACRAVSTSRETPIAPSQSSAATRGTSYAEVGATPTLPAATKTPETRATLHSAPTALPATTTEATPASLTLEGLAVSYNGVSFSVDPVLGETVVAHIESIGVVSFTTFALAPEGSCREVGCVAVYPVQQYEEAFPDWSLPPVGAATILRAQTQHLTFQNGSGTRSVKMYGQDVFWANNEDLVYAFEGFTDDGAYYASIIVPIDAPVLLSAADPNENTNSAALPVPAELPSDHGELSNTIGDYNREVARRLDLLDGADFDPRLGVLDALVASLRIDPPLIAPLGTAQLRTIGPLPLALGEGTGLRADPDGGLWVFATHGYMVLRDGHWTMQPSGRAQILVGVDDTERMWFLADGDGSEIYTWGGGPEYTLADAGWLPVPSPASLEGQGVLTDAAGQVWLATDRDVRVFDGARWSVFSREDLGMLPPADQDIDARFTLELVGDSRQLWVGECDWGGPGPVGGGGARWFDGQNWRGAESPVASGCVFAIREGRLGGVWVGVDSDLWRYDPAAEDWERFAPPQPPAGYRFSSITDVALDSAGEPWPLFPLCGGASCVIADARYHLHDGEWVQIGEPSSEPQSLVFDGGGTPWLFLGGRVYGIQDDRLTDLPGVELMVDAVTVDSAGWVWVTGTQPGGGTALWVLEREVGAADSLAVCPLPGEEQPPSPAIGEGQTVAGMFEPQILAYLNAASHAEGLQAALSGLTLPDKSGPDWQANSQVFSTDVTGDTTPEVVVDLSFFVKGQYADGALFVYRCQAGGYVGGVVDRISGQLFATTDPDPGIRFIQDMNDDGKSEIVFSYTPVIGTHGDFSREFRIVGWDGTRFLDLIQGDGHHPYVAEVRNGDGQLRDTDGDGALELELTSGVGSRIVDDASALDRPRTDIWAWNGEAFSLASTRATSPPLFRIQAIWDGDSATLHGDYEVALGLYQQAIVDDELFGWSPGRTPSDAAYSFVATPTPDADEHGRLSAYARYRMLLLHTAGGSLPEAQTVYDTLQEKSPEGAVGDEYAALATTFWDQYSADGEIQAGCDQARNHAAAHADQILSPLGSTFYGIGSPDYTPEDVCPFR